MPSATNTHTAAKRFWLSSLWLFLALRTADAINAFAGIYLVPKYVGAEELGAVLPLASFAAFLSLPLGWVSTVFMRQVAVLAEEKAFGEIKSLVRGMFLAGGVMFVLSLFGARLVIGDFLERIRIEEGSLGFLIVFAAFSASMAPVYTNVLVALKKFKHLSLLNVLSAPVRVASMVLLMPFRALSGYFAAQATPHLFTMAGSVLALRRELSVPAVPFWTKRRLREVAAFGGVAAVFMLAPSLQGLLETTALRQCLPADDSAAYYMTTRFSEIAGYVGATLATVLFPFAVSAGGKDQDGVRRLVTRAMAVSIGVGALLAAFFAVAGGSILAFLPDGALYSGYSPAMAVLTLVAGANAASSCAVNWLLASGRRRWLWWWCVLHVAYTILFWANSRHGHWTLWTIIAAQGTYAIVRLAAVLWSLRKEHK